MGLRGLPITNYSSVHFQVLHQLIWGILHGLNEPRLATGAVALPRNLDGSKSAYHCITTIDYQQYQLTTC